MSLTHWNTLTRDELNARLPEAVVVIPTGATEQHGPHLATGHDSVTVTDIAARGAEASAHDVIVTPCLMFGSSAHHLAFGGSLSLTTSTYRLVVTDLVRSVIAGGGRRIFLVNGHGGNAELNVLVARDLALEQPERAPVAIAAASYWDLARPALDALPDLAGLPWPGHAGMFETSTMLATAPGNVREPRPERGSDPYNPGLVPGARVEYTGLWRTFDGFTDFPHRATAEVGETILAAIVPAVAAAFDALASLDLSGAGSGTARAASC